MAVKLIIYTDLDGTLLGPGERSWRPAEKTIRLLNRLGVPLVICSSKTRTEILRYREIFHNGHPFISENGGGVFIPEGYFTAEPEAARREGGLLVIDEGVPYGFLREAVATLRSEGYKVKGFGDMTPEEVSALSGISIEEARVAKDREYDEPFTIECPDPLTLSKLFISIELMGLNHATGRFIHLMGGHDKGRAVGRLNEIYRRDFGDITTCAIGDAPNDIPMFGAVDYPFLVKRADGTYDAAVGDGRVIKAEGIGPEGWAEAVSLVLDWLGTRKQAA